MDKLFLKDFKVGDWIFYEDAKLYQVIEQKGKTTILADGFTRLGCPSDMSRGWPLSREILRDVSAIECNRGKLNFKNYGSVNTDKAIRSFTIKLFDASNEEKSRVLADLGHYISEVEEARKHLTEVETYFYEKE